MSDWFGTNSMLGTLEAGLDLEMPERPGMFYNKIERFFYEDPAGFEAMTKPRALCVLRVMARLGLLSGARGDFGKVRASLNSEAQRQVLRRVGAECSVLLKNSLPAHEPPLPLGRPSRAGGLAVLGPTARRLTTQGGGSASVKENPGSWDLVAALRSRFGEEAVSYALGTDTASVLSAPRPTELTAPSGSGMLDAQFVVGESWEEWPGDRPTSVQGTSLKQLDFGIFTGVYYSDKLPSRAFHKLGQAAKAWSARYLGNLVVQESGRYELSVGGTGRFKLYVDSKLVIEAAGNGESAELGGFLGALGDEARAEVTLSAGKPAALKVEWLPGPIRPSRMHLGFRAKPWVGDQLLEEAKRLAAAAETAVVVLGSGEREESEGHDQSSFELRGLELLEAVLSVQPRTVLCLNVGSPKRLPPELVERAAVMVHWFAGQEAGEALAMALCGEGWGPCGCLPTSWPKRLEDGVSGQGEAVYPGLGTKVQYSEGLLVGHRWFDSKGIEPLFPFGYGLSYARFEYGEVEARRTGEALELRVAVRNVSRRRGKQVLQAFVSQAEGWRKLVAFTKVALEAGEEDVAVMRAEAGLPGQRLCVIVAAGGSVLARYDL